MNNPSRTSLAAAFATLMLAIVGPSSFAGCFDPYKQGVETLPDGSIQMNSYAEGTQMCIRPGFKPENGCRECVVGQFHRCMAGGNWETRGEKCDVKKDTVPYISSHSSTKPTAPSVAEAEKAVRQPETADRTKSASTNSKPANLDAVYNACKSRPPNEIQACIDSELAKQADHKKQ